MEYTYVIEYEHLKDELVTNSTTLWNFNRVKDNANEFRMELSDEDFKRFFKLSQRDKDIGWLMYRMSEYNLNFIDALIMYITC